MRLRRFWFNFRVALKDAPPGIAIGCGVTAYDYQDALELIRERVFKNNSLPPIQKAIEDVDVSTLDANHVLPNMAVPVERGVWFPLGYN
jgi:hypothetical protein